MKLRQVIRFLALVGVFFLVSCAANKKVVFKANPELRHTIDTNFNVAAAQYIHMMKLIPPERFPKTYFEQTVKLETSNSDWWCSGFYPGTLLYLYEQTKDTAFLNEAKYSMQSLEKEKNNTSTHDLGFMMFCSFGNANRLEPSAAYKNILIQSAKSLSTRFDPKVGCIKSWDGKANEYLVIIDNMMNLELLFWATKVTGDSSFYKIAVTHAETTMKNHYRPDYSSYHVINYNAATGAVQEKRTAQGYANESAWARGQAWGLYGFTVMYRETKNKKYLDQANNIAHFLLNHPNLPADKIPYWDYNDPAIPNVLRDASAGAIMASALLELSTYAGKDAGANYFHVAETILETLSTDQYRAKVGTNGGFILKHSVGHMPQKSEVDVPLTYADYYFVEAMKRYKQMTKEKHWQKIH